MSRLYSRIVGTGRCVPEKILTNADLEKMVDTTDEWIRTRTGIHQRHIAGPHETTSSLALGAARQAMQAAGVSASDIDFVVVGTTTPDLVFPNVATQVSAALGIEDRPAFSLETACSSFMYSLSIADKFVRCGEAQCALVIGADTLSRIVDWSDRNTCVLFADGAGAVILKPSSEPGILTTHISADGQYKDLLYFPMGVSSGWDRLRAGDAAAIQMRGNEVFKVAVKTLSALAEQTLEKAGLSKQDLDWLVPHQANLRIIDAVARKLDLPMEKVVVTIQDFGNTSSAAVPMALDVAIRDGRMRPGQLALLEAFGGGFTWGSALVRL